MQPTSSMFYTSYTLTHILSSSSQVFRRREIVFAMDTRRYHQHQPMVRTLHFLKIHDLLRCTRKVRFEVCHSSNTVSATLMPAFAPALNLRCGRLCTNLLLSQSTAPLLHRKDLDHMRCHAGSGKQTVTESIKRTHLVS